MKYLKLLFALLLSPSLMAQETVTASQLENEFSVDSFRENLDYESPSGKSQSRELKVIAQTLSPAEIDQAILNRLLQEAIKEPEETQRVLGLDESQLKNIVISLSNARSFINTNELTAVRAMCDAFHRSETTGDERIQYALNAYENRAQFTKDFIQRFYSLVMDDIESSLNSQALVSLQHYMNDRRRRMATAGNISLGIPTQNPTSGFEAVAFHCGPSKN